jgi:hypothetical protein
MAFFIVDVVLDVCYTLSFCYIRGFLATCKFKVLCRKCVKYFGFCFVRLQFGVVARLAAYIVSVCLAVCCCCCRDQIAPRSERLFCNVVVAKTLAGGGNLRQSKKKAFFADYF